PRRYPSATEVEGRQAAFKPEVVVVRRRQRVAVGSTDAAAVVYRLAPRKRTEEGQAARETLLNFQIEGVVTGMTRRIHHLEGLECRERARVVRIRQLARLRVVVLL